MWPATSRYLQIADPERARAVSKHPLNEEVLHLLRQYRLARGGAKAEEPFFRSREGNGLSRKAIYERVRGHACRAKLTKRVSPHWLRHTFATHLVQEGVGLVTIRDLLGHRQVTSTQIYIHLTAQDLRKAADKHPVTHLIKRMEELLPNFHAHYLSVTLLGAGVPGPVTGGLEDSTPRLLSLTPLGSLWGQASEGSGDRFSPQPGTGEIDKG